MTNSFAKSAPASGKAGFDIAKTSSMGAILSKSLTLRGFINDEFAEHHYDEFLREVGAGIREGRIRYREDIVDGLEKAPEAFIGMLDGQNFGKAIVRVSA